MAGWLSPAHAPVAVPNLDSDGRTACGFSLTRDGGRFGAVRPRTPGDHRRRRRRSRSNTIAEVVARDSPVDRANSGLDVASRSASSVSTCGSCPRRTSRNGLRHPSRVLPIVMLPMPVARSAARSHDERCKDWPRTRQREPGHRRCRASSMSRRAARRLLTPCPAAVGRSSLLVRIGGGRSWPPARALHRPSPVAIPPPHLASAWSTLVGLIERGAKTNDGMRSDT